MKCGQSAAVHLQFTCLHAEISQNFIDLTQKQTFLTWWHSCCRKQSDCRITQAPGNRVCTGLYPECNQRLSQVSYCKQTLCQWLTLISTDWLGLISPCWQPVCLLKPSVWPWRRSVWRLVVLPPGELCNQLVVTQAAGVARSASGKPAGCSQSAAQCEKIQFNHWVTS